MQVTNDLLMPSTYNVYGYICCGDEIMQVKKVLSRTLGIDNDFALTNCGVLIIKEPTIEIEIRRKERIKWSVSAAVAGDNEVVLDMIFDIAKKLKWSGFSSNYEIYNDQFECVSTVSM